MKTILIIEDDTNINNMIKEILEKREYVCIQAFSGTEGVLYAEKESPALVILDLMLPGMAGEEVLVKIKENKDIPVIVLSAKDSLDSKISLLNCGAEDYMTKPFEGDELAARVNVQLRRFAAQKEKEKQLTYKELLLDEKIILFMLPVRSCHLPGRNIKSWNYSY